MRSRWVSLLAAGLLALPLVGCGGNGGSAGGSSSGSTRPVQILETGSSLLYPLFNIWQGPYQSAHPGVRLTTQSTGSGVGISSAIKGLAQIGASDAYMSDPQATANPDLLNIPLVISAQQINYNLPGLNSQHLHLSGPVLAGIYTGAIKDWNDAAIQALNPGVQLPHQPIIPVRRSDGSGDTFLFTQYLSKSSASTWPAGYSTQITWPAVRSELAENGNQGVEQALKQNPYSIGYVGISWLDQATKDGLGYAALENQAGSFVLPTQTNIEAAVAAAVPNVPADERVSLIFSSGANSYPIINFEYAIVNAKQPNAATASALRALLTWALDPSGGSTAQYLNQVHFVPLPASVVKLSQTQIQKIGA